MLTLHTAFENPIRIAVRISKAVRYLLPLIAIYCNSNNIGTSPAHRAIFRVDVEVSKTFPVGVFYFVHARSGIQKHATTVLK